MILSQYNNEEDSFFRNIDAVPLSDVLTLANSIQGHGLYNIALQNNNWLKLEVGIAQHGNEDIKHLNML